ncbi:hypothetical protein AVEN_97422-1 [Araneus ventricosus]|uniref:Uncharacterized protein n=1 Tax=Araneus ventricosus TaxID=182803 RepID=A0A4Y2EJ04_ARAVE|nr:hypothetical protein AVEN_97422-1 [Araneus ventricosus]
METDISVQVVTTTTADPWSSSEIQKAQLEDPDTRTTALHLESDGMTERFYRKILNNLSLFVSKKQTDWGTRLALFLLAYRSAVHEVTGWTLSEMLFGRTPRLPCGILFGRLSDMPSSPNVYMNKFRGTFGSVHSLARQ